ncbi:DUF3108 domain-containing protein [Fulvivirgaceae bacterium BMA10]|uniref:DUF3108 domain-containing protein n=1 Tax=Splendidivirga corallicola TaxID=3051826 RepID=A0ABT8KJ75_9BACT|nr:DUF3108 domain-containing protein [Fulvivirgaceae bacterium BMA10]
MKLSLRTILFLLILSSFTSTKKTYRYIKNESFRSGEKLEYRVHLGFLSGATATMEISETVYQINGRPCFKVNVFGRTAGIIDVFYKVRDNWGSYIDTAAIVPHRFYRYIKENRYRKNEIVNFNHDLDTATVARLDKKTRKLLKKDKFAVPNNVQDLVSGYYFLRTLDLSKYKSGDIININAFFDDEIYDMKIKMLGTERIKTKVGRFEAYKLAPVLPENSLFKDENSIKVWISKDKNKLPLKIKADMFVGAIEVDIKSYKNIRNKIQQ